MAKNITRIVLTGGPAAGKTTLVSRLLKEFKQEDGWKVIVIPETATELISGFGFGPFPNCMSMYDFQFFVFADQFHKEQLALKAAEKVPQENVLILYDRAIFDNRAYVNDEEFDTILASFGKTKEEVLAGYDAVIHLVSSAKGAEFAFDYGNAARYEGIDEARHLDDLALRSWSVHPSVHVIDNSVDFNNKMDRAVEAIYGILGREVPERAKRKYLIEKPDIEMLEKKYSCIGISMTQTYLAQSNPNIYRRVRERRYGDHSIYFYIENRTNPSDNKHWVTERALSKKEYEAYCLEREPSMKPVSKTKYRFNPSGRSMEIDIYPFSDDKAVLFVYGEEDCVMPEGIKLITEITGDPKYKNRILAYTQTL